jgi:hypothetical protein
MILVSRISSGVAAFRVESPFAGAKKAKRILCVAASLASEMNSEASDSTKFLFGHVFGSRIAREAVAP